MIRKLTILSAAIALSCSALAAANTSGDNTRMNKSARGSSAATADQQSNSATDTNITRQIRQDIMSQDNLSTYAQNIKVVSQNGRVTLSGPVRSAQEHRDVLEHARSVAGVTNVDDQITVVRE